MEDTILVTGRHDLTKSTDRTSLPSTLQDDSAIKLVINIITETKEK